jgi:hypothetical protein
MITFVLNNVTTAGFPQVKENGDTLQTCIVEVKIEGLISQNKFLSDIVDFTIPNSVMVNQAMPTVAGWEYIKNVLAPQWVEDNYKEI